MKIIKYKQFNEGLFDPEYEYTFSFNEDSNQFKRNTKYTTLKGAFEYARQGILNQYNYRPTDKTLWCSIETDDVQYRVIYENSEFSYTKYIGDNNFKEIDINKLF